MLVPRVENSAQVLSCWLKLARATDCFAPSKKKVFVTLDSGGRDNFYQQDFSHEQGKPPQQRRSAGGSSDPIQFAASQVTNYL
jgi:hypothetical protein